MKKPFWIIIIILGILAVGVGLFFAWRNAKQIITPPVETPGGISELPEGGTTQGAGEAQGGPVSVAAKKLSSGEIIDYWIGQSGSGANLVQTVYYIDSENKIWKIGEKEPESVRSIDNVVIFARPNISGERVVLKIKKDEKDTFEIINITSGDIISFSNVIESMDWSPDAKKIAYIERLASGEAAIALETGNNTRRGREVIIPKINLYDRELRWISPDTILLLPKPTAFFSDQIYIVSVKAKTIKPFGGSAAGTMFSWLSSAKYGLLFNSSRNGRSTTFNFTDANGSIVADIGFMSIPSKCDANDSNMYCFVPEEIPSKIIMPDDYLKKAFYSKDGLYQLNFKDNFLVPLIISGAPLIDAEKVRYAGGKIYFVNRYDRALYSYELPAETQ